MIQTLKLCVAGFLETIHSLSCIEFPFGADRVSDASLFETSFEAVHRIVERLSPGGAARAIYRCRPKCWTGFALRAFTLIRSAIYSLHARPRHIIRSCIRRAIYHDCLIGFALRAFTLIR